MSLNNVSQEVEPRAFDASDEDDGGPAVELEDVAGGVDDRRLSRKLKIKLVD